MSDFLNRKINPSKKSESLFVTQLIDSQPDLPPPSYHVWRGHLIPVVADQPEYALGGETLVVDRPRFMIGRSANCHLRLTAADISREHACLRSSQNVFYLEDTGSRFGTYLNGERILASRLCDGDLIRFGQGTAFRFERRAVQTDGPFEIQEDVLPRLLHRPAGQMTVTFWGCRGSMPTPGPSTEVHGGNTTCIELRFENSIHVIDAGTGIAKFSKQLSRETSGQPPSIRLYFTHLHWDHIQGFPFFQQAYQREAKLEIFEVHAMRGTIHETLRKQMQAQYFPVPMEAMNAAISFPSLSEKADANGLRVRKFLLPHPGGSFAYRFETNQETFLFASDCELEQFVEGTAQLTTDLPPHRVFSAEAMAFFRNIDLLVIDCQYTDEIYATRTGWGHNSTSVVIDFCSQVMPRHVVLTHHDPDSSDQMVFLIAKTVREGLKELLGKDAPTVSAAREEMTVFVTDPQTGTRPPDQDVTSTTGVEGTPKAPRSK